MSEFANIINMINENTEYQKFKEDYQLNDKITSKMTDIIATGLMEDNVAIKDIYTKIEAYIQNFKTVLDMDMVDDNFLEDILNKIQDDKKIIKMFGQVSENYEEALHESDKKPDKNILSVNSDTNDNKENVNTNTNVSDISVPKTQNLRNIKSAKDRKQAKAKQLSARRQTLLQKLGGKKRLRNATKKKRNLRKKKHTRRKKRKTRRN